MKRNRKVWLSLMVAAGLGVTLLSVTGRDGWFNGTPRNGANATAQRDAAPNYTTAAPPPTGNGSGNILASGWQYNARSPITSDGTNLTGKLVDGTYRGARFNAIYGFVQLDVTVNQGKVADVKAREYPNHTGNSRYISSIAVPYLVQETINTQNARIHLISGATLTSQAFVRSLDTALQQALKPQFRTSATQG